MYQETNTSTLQPGNVQSNVMIIGTMGALIFLNFMFFIIQMILFEFFDASILLYVSINYFVQMFSQATKHFSQIINVCLIYSCYLALKWGEKIVSHKGEDFLNFRCFQKVSFNIQIITLIAVNFHFLKEMLILIKKDQPYLNTNQLIDFPYYNEGVMFDEATRRTENSSLINNEEYMATTPNIGNDRSDKFNEVFKGEGVNEVLITNENLQNKTAANNIENNANADGYTKLDESENSFVKNIDQTIKNDAEEKKKQEEVKKEQDKKEAWEKKRLQMQNNNNKTLEENQVNSDNKTPEEIQVNSDNKTPKETQANIDNKTPEETQVNNESKKDENQNEKNDTNGDNQANDYKADENKDNNMAETVLNNENNNVQND